MTGISKEDILSKSRLDEVVRCRAMIVELMGSSVGHTELGRYLNIDHSSVIFFRQGNSWDKWKIKDQLGLQKNEIEMVSNQINFTYPGNYTYITK